MSWKALWRTMIESNGEANASLNDEAATGIGGVMKAEADDFVVEEIPAYEPCGEGEHLYLFIEKRGATTSRVVEELRRTFHVGPKHVGLAGLKDRQAVTRQWFSIHDPARKINDLEAAAMELPWMRVLDAVRHGNKLRRGHLLGNRFRIAVREVNVGAAPRALQTLRMLESAGAPNFFGDQRYGSRGNNHLIGRALVLGHYNETVDRLLGMTEPGDTDRVDAPARRHYHEEQFEAAIGAIGRGAAAERTALHALKRGSRGEKVLRSINVRDREFWVSAFQSAIFDDVLRERLDAGELATLREGDVAFKHGNGSLFDVRIDDLNDELAARLDAFEISPSGPLWGPAMKLAGGAVGEQELRALERTGVDVAALDSFSLAWKERGLGSRRSLRMPVQNVGIEAGADERGEHITCIFDLPAGSFATVVMTRVMTGAWEMPTRW